MFLRVFSQALGQELGRPKDEPTAFALKEQVINEEMSKVTASGPGGFQAGCEGPGRLPGGGVLEPAGWAG